MSDDGDGVVVPMRGLEAPDGWVPDFPGQRPPFPAGNTLGLRHGAYSDRVVAPVARHLVDAQLEAARAPGSPTAYLLDETYRPALQAWAEAEARAERFAAHLAEHDCEGCKRCARWDEDFRRWQSIAMNHRQRLGFDPLSRARLGKDVASARVDMARLMAEAQEDDR